MKVHILKRQEENTKKRTQYQESAGHYSACCSPSPISSSSASSSLSQFQPTGGAVLPRYFARSLEPPGGTYHPPIGRPRATSASPSSFLDPRPHHSLLVLLLVAVLEQASRLASTTTVFWVAPPAVVVRPVLRAFQVHTRTWAGRAARLSSSLPWPGSDRVCLFFRRT